jgi:hypothetical protein
MKLFTNYIALITMLATAILPSFPSISHAALSGPDQARIQPFNLILDPGFEMAGAGWTASGGAAKQVSISSKGTGSVGYDWNSNAAAQTLTTASYPIPPGLRGQNGLAYCNIKAIGTVGTYTIGVDNGSGDIDPGQVPIVSNTTSFTKAGVNFIFPNSGSIRLKLKSVAADEPEIYIDDCYLGLASNLTLIDSSNSDAINTTAVLGSWTTNTTYETRYKKIGDYYLIEWFWALTGAPNSVAQVLTLPNSLVLDVTKLANGTTPGGNYRIPGSTGTYLRTATDSMPLGAFYNNTTSISVHYLRAGSSSTSDLAALTQASPYNAGAGDYGSVSIMVPIVGSSTPQIAVQANQQNYDWRPYTPTFTNFGTVTNIACL